MLELQTSLKLSQYSGLYDIILKKDNFYRRLHDEIDYSFIITLLADSYDGCRGRKAVDPIRMVKYTMLKALTDLSDADLVSHVSMNMGMKYFLDMAPEEEPIEKSTLSAFRTRRIADPKVLAELLWKTVEIAVEKGLLRLSKDGKIQVETSIDSTHIPVAGEWLGPVKAISHYCDRLRRAVANAEPKWADTMEEPKKFGNAESALAYGKRMVAHVRENFPAFELRCEVRERLNRLEEVIEDVQERSMYCPSDREAMIGHKSKEKIFSGYKAHIIVENENGLAIDCQVTTGEKNDTTVGRPMLEKMLDNESLEVGACLGDSAYSSGDIAEMFDKAGVELLSKPNKILGSSNAERNGFTYNKDADSITCPAGHLAVSKTLRHYWEEYNRPVMMYYFDIDKCKCCKYREGCYKEGSKTKSYSVSINTESQKRLLERMRNPEKKKKYKRRTISERGNSELKNRCGLYEAYAKGLKGVTVQTVMALFAYNLRIILRKTETKTVK